MNPFFVERLAVRFFENLLGLDQSQFFQPPDFEAQSGLADLFFQGFELEVFFILYQRQYRVLKRG